jgi:hypothetical protein
LVELEAFVKKVKELNIPVAKPLLDMHTNLAFHMKKLNSEPNTKFLLELEM